MSKTDAVSLELPTRTGYARLARIAAASIALRVGFPLRVIDDLRLALDEAMILLLAPGDESDRILIDYSVEDHTILVMLRRTPSRRTSEAGEQRFLDLTAELVDERTVDSSSGTLTLRKSLPS
ncbi:MAG: hypothetical protein IH940_02765 [Acidobacteria bacterium]|nr:hypothetical protein [Acidobacteriota bacterium]